MKHVVHLLAEYYDEELPARRRQQVEAHLSGCEDCRSELAQWVQLSNVLSTYKLPTDLAPVEVFRAQVMLQVSRRRKPGVPYRAWFWYAVPFSLAGGLVFLQSLIASLLLLVVLDWGDWITSLILPGWQWIETQVAWGDALWVASWVGLLDVALQLSLYILLFLSFIPYIGWVGLLLRSTRRGREFAV